MNSPDPPGGRPYHPGVRRHSQVQITPSRVEVELTPTNSTRKKKKSSICPLYNEFIV